MLIEAAAVVAPSAHQPPITLFVTASKPMPGMSQLCSLIKFQLLFTVALRPDCGENSAMQIPQSLYLNFVIVSHLCQIPILIKNCNQIC